MAVPDVPPDPKLKSVLELERTLRELHAMLERPETPASDIDNEFDETIIEPLQGDVTSEPERKDLESLASRLALSQLESPPPPTEPSQKKWQKWRSSAIKTFKERGESPFFCLVPHLGPSAVTENGPISGEILVPVASTYQNRKRVICVESPEEVTGSWDWNGSDSKRPQTPASDLGGQSICSKADWGLGPIHSSPTASAVGEPSYSEDNPRNTKTLSWDWEIRPDGSNHAFHSNASSRSMSLASENSQDPYRHPDHDSLDDPFYLDRSFQPCPDTPGSS